MKATEFRLGNLLINKLNEIVSVDWNDFEAACIGVPNYFDNYFTPIPITEDWLLKFGATKGCNHDAERFNLLGYGVYLKCDHPCAVVMEGCCMEEVISDNLKYIHQLQNLYFALTGEELQIQKP